MWTAVRLLVVCALGVSGVFALRSGLPSRLSATRAPAFQAHRASNVIPGDLVSESEDAPIEEVGKKVVNVEVIRVEPVRLAALQAFDQAAPAEPKSVTRYRTHVHHRHWHRGKRRHR